MNKDCDDIVVVSTALAIELCKGKTLDELFTIKNMLSQVLCTMQTIISERLSKK